MKCEYCDNLIPKGAASCPSCGAPVSIPEKQLSPEQLNQMQKQDALNREKELIQQQMELEKLRQEREEEANRSPCKKSIFVLLGLFFGFLGIQFLYVHRFYSFTLGLTCFILSMIYSRSDWAPFEVVIALTSSIVSILIGTDGEGRKMKWF